MKPRAAAWSSGLAERQEATMADSTVTLVGNLTRDPELRFTQSGQAIATLGIAVSRRYQQNGEWQEKTSFFNITAWGQLGENAASSLSKGSRAIVTGRLEQRSYETADGEKRSVVEVVADEIGPSLRWATAQVDRNDRREGGAPAGASSGAAPRGGTTTYDDTEEPF
jgi:single-strand DNA-binding protein